MALFAGKQAVWNRQLLAEPSEVQINNRDIVFDSVSPVLIEVSAPVIEFESLFSVNDNIEYHLPQFMKQRYPGQPLLVEAVFTMISLQKAAEEIGGKLRRILIETFVSHDVKQGDRNIGGEPVILTIVKIENGDFAVIDEEIAVVHILVHKAEGVPVGGEGLNPVQ